MAVLVAMAAFPAGPTDIFDIPLEVGTIGTIAKKELCHCKFEVSLCLNFIPLRNLDICLQKKRNKN